jgi:hypothetical protein
MVRVVIARYEPAPRRATAPSTKSGAVLLELSRSRMLDSGWDLLPPDVRFAGGSLQNESSALDHPLPTSALDGDTIM